MAFTVCIELDPTRAEEAFHEFTEERMEPHGDIFQWYGFTRPDSGVFCVVYDTRRFIGSYIASYGASPSQAKLIRGARFVMGGEINRAEKVQTCIIPPSIKPGSDLAMWAAIEAQRGVIVKPSGPTMIGSALYDEATRTALFIYRELEESDG